MTKDLKILITGASGFLGNHLVQLLLDKGYQNIIGLYHDHQKSDLPIQWVASDMNHLSEIEDLFVDTDVLIHLAAKLSYQQKDKNKIHQVNVIGTRELVNIAIAQQIKKIIYVSSASTLIKNNKPKLVSESISGKPYFYSHYAKSKYLGELEIQRAAAEGMDILILNPPLMLGAGDWTRGSLQVLFRIYKGLWFYPIGNLAIVDVKNVAFAIVNNLQTPSQPKPNLIFDFQLSYKKFIGIVCKNHNFKRPRFGLSPILNPFIAALDKLRSLLLKSPNIITLETAKITSQSFEYETSRNNLYPSQTQIGLDELISQSVNFNINNK